MELRVWGRIQVSPIQRAFGKLAAWRGDFSYKHSNEIEMGRGLHMSFGSASCELALLAATAPGLLVVVAVVVVVVVVVPAVSGSPRVFILRRRGACGGGVKAVSLCVGS